MAEFEDELFLKRETRRSNLRNQKNRNKMKWPPAGILGQTSGSLDLDNFALSFIQQSPDRSPLDLHSILDAHPVPMIEDSVDEFSFEDTEAINDLIQIDSMDSMDSGERHDMEEQLDLTVIDLPYTCSQTSRALISCQTFSVLYALQRCVNLGREAF
jgi:hypothetical protein